MKCRRLTQLGEPAVQYRGVRQEDAPLPWPEVGESRVEIVGDHAAVEPVDHPVAEADRQDARRRGSGRRGEFGADGGEGAGHPVGSDLHVDARVVVEVDEQRGVLTLAHAEEGQGNRFCDHRVVEDSGVGAGRQVPDAGLAGPGFERRGSLVRFFADEDVETVGPDRDAEHRGPRCAGAVGGVGEEVTEAGEPEQAVGPGVVAERELEVGERTVRCREGDAPAGGAPHALAAPPALERTEESDGAQAEDARADGEGPDVVALPARGGVVSPGGLVDIVWAARGRAGVMRRRCAVNGRPRAARVGRVVGAGAVLWLLHGAVWVGADRAMDDRRRRGCLGRCGGRDGCHRLGLGDVGGDSVRDDEGPARVDPVGVAERSATGLRYADVGRVDGLPVLAVAVVGGRDAPQGVTGHHGVRHRGGLCTDRWHGVGRELRDWRDGGHSHGGAGHGGGRADARASSRRGAELAENDDGGDDGGDEGGGGAVAPEPVRPVPSARAKVGDHGGGDTEREVGPDQPGQRGEEVGPERVGNRGPQRPRDLGTAREMVRERPADHGGQDDGDPHHSGGQDDERAEPF